ncbi:SMCHD1 [Cordylochernes scorpioides]|uniref:SMCHD1 n=1 Tax=Cordylochernes scorpioides TaxID=51811 RepID=A0ABY6LCR5_9ARAC|nr:SMCHD1 [Cordylochernes scorpioides]
MLEMTRTDPEWKDKIITGYETWVYGYDPETKHQSAEWRCQGKGDQKKKKKEKNGEGRSLKTEPYKISFQRKESITLQSSAVISSFNPYCLIQEFEIPHNNFFITETSRRIVTDDNFDQVENGSALYLLNHPDQELDMTREEIEFQPHYSTTIRSGVDEYYNSQGGQYPLELHNMAQPTGSSNSTIESLIRTMAKQQRLMMDLLFENKNKMVDEEEEEEEEESEKAEVEKKSVEADESEKAEVEKKSVEVEESEKAQVDKKSVIETESAEPLTKEVDVIADSGMEP